MKSSNLRFLFVANVVTVNYDCKEKASSRTNKKTTCPLKAFMFIMLLTRF